MRTLIAFLLLSLGLLAMPARATATLPESDVQAAIIVNFVHYVEWPDNPAPTAEMLICVTGRSPVADALLAYNGKTVHGRRVAVENRSYFTSTSQCRVLYIADNPSHSSVEWLRDLSGQPILTVSEGEDFLPNGGIISLNRMGNRIAFDVNLSAMRRSSLRIGSQLLRLARDVHGK